MPDLHWTERLPSAEGWWWWRADCDGCAVVVKVVAEAWGELRVCSDGLKRDLEIGGEWAGPLAPPPDEAIRAAPDREGDGGD